jgi:hypothetical protein
LKLILFFREVKERELEEKVVFKRPTRPFSFCISHAIISRVFRLTLE